MFVFELEQAPYKIDQWNALNDVCGRLVVIYSVAEPNAAKSEHDFSVFPESNFSFVPARRGFLRPVQALIALHRLYNSCAAPQEPVLVCGYSSVATFLACLYCGIRGLPLFLHTDAVQSSPNEVSSGLVFKSRFLLGKLVRLILSRFVDVVLVCGEVALAGLQSSAFRKAIGISFPYVVSRSRLERAAGLESLRSKDDDRFRIMFSGRLVERKGCRTLLEALRIINDPRIHLTVEGGGELRGSLELLAHDLPPGTVDFVGPRDFPEHYALMKSVDLVCVPSHYDGWGIVVDEAQQLSRLVVASNRVGSALNRISSGKNGFLFKAGDSRDLASVIETCRKLPLEVRREIERQAGIDASLHSPETYARRFVEELSRAGFSFKRPQKPVDRK